ncbi:MAG TPA: hypothetical protein ENF38_01340 [Candidatus Aenigmarchaeota archaeon]|nr:hypothetical protein [Candidatus Aenigmarchaeota archaeon]
MVVEHSIYLLTRAVAAVFSLLSILFLYGTYRNIKKYEKPALSRFYLIGKKSITILAISLLSYTFLWFLSLFKNLSVLGWFASPTLQCGFSLSFYLLYRATKMVP